MSPPLTRTLRTPASGALVLAFSILVVPAAATFILPMQRMELVGPLWFLGLIPTFLMAYAYGWQGAATAMASTVALLVLVHLVAAPLARGVPSSLAWVLPVFLATGSGLGWLTSRLRNERPGAGTEALVDLETGLPSEQHARLLLENEFWSAERGRLVTVILFELEGFEDFVRRQGPQAARSALAGFGQILASTTRRMNLSGRAGSARFMSILDGTDEEGATLFAERVREAFRSTAAGEDRLAMSAGVASYQPSMKSPDDLVAAAELALQRARESGGGCVRIFGHPGSGRTPRQGVPHPPERLDGYREPRIGSSRGSGEPTGRIALEGKGRKVLLVEDETAVRTLISANLQKRSFSVFEAQDTGDAMGALSDEFDLAVVGLGLADSSGRDLVAAVKARWPDTPVIAVTGFQDAKLAAEALTAGADRYLFRPFGMAELEGHLSDLLTLRDHLLELRERRTAQGRLVASGADRALLAVLNGVRGIVRATEIVDPCTAGHSERVRDYTIELLDALEAEEGNQGIDRELLRLACELHDVGRIAVPAEILNKDAPLTDDEYARVRDHPQVGRSILAPLLGEDLILAVTGWHHERWDGKGYPDGLAGPAIPLPARLVGISDSLDAMTSPRAYRAGLVWEDAVEQVRTRAGSQFDPGLLSAFNAALPRLHQIYVRSFEETDDEPGPADAQASLPDDGSPSPDVAGASPFPSSDDQPPNPQRDPTS